MFLQLHQLSQIFLRPQLLQPMLLRRIQLLQLRHRHRIGRWQPQLRRYFLEMDLVKGCFLDLPAHQCQLFAQVRLHLQILQQPHLR